MFVLNNAREYLSYPLGKVNRTSFGFALLHLIIVLKTRAALSHLIKSKAKTIRYYSFAHFFTALRVTYTFIYVKGGET